MHRLHNNHQLLRIRRKKEHCESIRVLRTGNRKNDANCQKNETCQVVPALAVSLAMTRSKLRSARFQE